MKVLVTGGAGYIGGFMTRLLLEKDISVIVVDSLERGHSYVVDSRATFVRGDMQDAGFIEKVLSSHTVDAVIHFAGYISVGESTKFPGKYFNNNILSTVNLLESMVKHSVSKFIFSSTAAVYGNPDKIPIPENAPLVPTSPYGESKFLVERIAHWYHIAHGLNIAILRYFNAAGGALDGQLGEQHEPETHIIPNAIQAVLSGSEFFLYGNDYDTKDGTCVRDYVHVLDLVEAHLLVFEKLDSVKKIIYNVGTGTGFSNKDVIDMVKKVTGIDFTVVYKERRPGDPDTLIADVTKINNELDFSPKYSDLETIVKTAWKWHKNRPK